MFNPRIIHRSSKPGLPAELAERVRRAGQDWELAARAGPRRLPVWVAASILGAGLLAGSGCGKKDTEPGTPARPGLEAPSMKPDGGVPGPELESSDPMDPEPGQMDPSPVEMGPIPPAMRGADGLPGGFEDMAEAPGDLLVMGPAGGGGIAYGAPPMGAANVRVSLGRVVVSGKLGVEDVKPVLEAQAREVRQCYLKGLLEDPKLEGEVRVVFLINPNGRAQACQVEQNLSVKVVGDTLCTRVQTWKFPNPDGGLAKVTASWTFNPGL